jgi:hypothetical protein
MNGPTDWFSAFNGNSSLYCDRWMPTFVAGMEKMESRLSTPSALLLSIFFTVVIVMIAAAVPPPYIPSAAELISIATWSSTSPDLLFLEWFKSTLPLPLSALFQLLGHVLEALCAMGFQCLSH